MSKTSKRLKAYQRQMSIYAEQHKIILASDVLNMIEQLQDDLKDDIDDIVSELEEEKDIAYADFDKYVNDYELDLDSEYDDLFHRGLARAINVVRK